MNGSPIARQMDSLQREQGVTAEIFEEENIVNFAPVMHSDRVFIHSESNPIRSPDGLLVLTVWRVLALNHVPNDIWTYLTTAKFLQEGGRTRGTCSPRLSHLWFPSNSTKHRPVQLKLPFQRLGDSWNGLAALQSLRFAELVCDTRIANRTAVKLRRVSIAASRTASLSKYSSTGQRGLIRLQYSPCQVRRTRRLRDCTCFWGATHQNCKINVHTGNREELMYVWPRLRQDEVYRPAVFSDMGHYTESVSLIRQAESRSRPGKRTIKRTLQSLRGQLYLSSRPSRGLQKSQDRGSESELQINIAVSSPWNCLTVAHPVHMHSVFVYMKSVSLMLVGVNILHTKRVLTQGFHIL